jgi:hypothetical protein
MLTAVKSNDAQSFANPPTAPPTVAMPTSVQSTPPLVISWLMIEPPAPTAVPTMF